MSSSNKVIEQLFEGTGIKINGTNAWDIQVHNTKLYNRVLGNGSLALGESYMEGWWDCDALDDFFSRVLKQKLEKKIALNASAFFHVAKARLFNLQSKTKASDSVRWHYDIGNELYRKMLDKRMVYSCGYWKDAKNLDDAQEAKLDLICRKLQMEKGMRLLDIGCGWGGLAQYAAERYGVSVVGITLSEQQAIIARYVNRDLPVEIREQDYRDLHENFDRIVSVGMFEHVGYKNYRTLMQVASENLSTDGIFLLHTIGGNESVNSSDPWIDRYIFPNSMLPSIEQIAKAIEGLFIMEDWHNFGVYYDLTCMAWFKNFEQNWLQLELDYDYRFYRMWRYYLCMSAATFRARKNQLWQIILTKPGRQGAYTSIR